MSIEIWPILEPGQVRWLGEWGDVGCASGRSFVGRHPEGRVFGGEVCAADDRWIVQQAPWQEGEERGDAPDRDTAKRLAEQFVAEMFGAEVKAP